MAEYWQRAIYIYEHGQLYENSWRMPGYPVALSLAFTVGFGPSLLAARALNVLAGLVTALLTYWLARRSAGPRLSFVAAMSVACYPSLLIYTVFVATEAIVTVPIMSALTAASYGTRWAAVPAGVFTGLAALVRPAGVALLPAVVFAFARVRDSSDRNHWSLRAPALVVLAFALVMMPWWAHNARVYGRFVPLDTTGGLNLLIGNGPLATGYWRWNDVSRLQPEYLNGVDVTTPAGDDAATALALAQMFEHPLSVLRLLPAKMAALLAIEGREPAYAYSIGYLGARRSTANMYRSPSFLP